MTHAAAVQSGHYAGGHFTFESANSQRLGAGGGAGGFAGFLPGELGFMFAPSRA